MPTQYIVPTSIVNVEVVAPPIVGSLDYVDFYAEINQIQPYTTPTYLQDLIYQSSGEDFLEESVVVTSGSLTLQEEVVIVGGEDKFDLSVEVFKNRCNLYRDGKWLLRYLPESFKVLDKTEDLTQFLEVFALSADEFYCFIKDFTTIFDPDTCSPKYLKFLAHLINYPLNTRGFDSTTPAVRDAAILRARTQLKEAVEVYKRKGMKEAFQILFYSLGYYIELVELWTENYISFHEEVPSTGMMYDPVTNTSGWFKSPYFGIRLVSINQQTVCTTDGSGQPWSFTTEDFSEILEAIHRVRPVNTVLWWIEYNMDLCDIYEFTDITDGTLEPVPTDKFFLECEPDDPIYFRGDMYDPYNPLKGDPRLFGVIRDPFPNELDLSLPGESVALVGMVRDPQEGLCGPHEDFLIDISDINWNDEPWCTQVFRSCGVLYRDGSNGNPRNGENPTRDPSCFGGRNGEYWRGEEPAGPYAPYTEGVENGLVPDRSGCYTTDDHIVPLWQIAEEFEDGIVKYYNKFEFENWLDTIVIGPGPDPDITGDNTSLPEFNLVNIDTTANTLSSTSIVDSTDPSTLWSLFGKTSGGTGTKHISRLVFSSGVLSSVDDITPTIDVTDTEPQGYYGGFTGTDGDNLFYLYGYKGTNVKNKNIIMYDITSNIIYKLGESAGFRLQAAYAQVGGKMYMFGGTSVSELIGGGENEYQWFNTTTKTLSAEFTMPFSFIYGSAVVVNDSIYLFGGIDEIGSGNINYKLYRYHTVTDTFTLVSTAPVGAQFMYGVKKNNKLMFYSEDGNWSDPSYGSDIYLQFDLTTSTWLVKRFATNLPTGVVPVRMVEKSGRFYGTNGSFSGTANNVVQMIQRIS